MNLATEFDLFGSLGNSGEGLAGAGGRGGQKGKSSGKTSSLPPLAGLSLPSLSCPLSQLSGHPSHYRTPSQEMLKDGGHGPSNLAHSFIHSFILTFDEMLGPHGASDSRLQG